MTVVENLDHYFDAFGVSATYTPVGGTAKTISVIFDNEFSAVQGGIGDGAVGSSGPQVLCKTADVVNAARGDTLVIGGVTYKVIESRPDGTGMTTLILSRD